MGIPPRNYLYIVCKPTEQTAYLRVCLEKGGNFPQEEPGCSCDLGDNTCEVTDEFRASIWIGGIVLASGYAVLFLLALHLILELSNDIINTLSWHVHTRLVQRITSMGPPCGPVRESRAVFMPWNHSVLTKITNGRDIWAGARLRVTFLIESM
ncbi:hypothetical protein BJ322DRAFT_1191719 [Thelephora terrestris]|uniref:Uncharacterized protein n=1 Tax=Thelephora terrestris TaxID=56493 RepID=A0A9P6HJ80_9AGAM|nr:hypothetical protein BJ322DRAFT_1191719 [Thelephora terrestris]